MRVQRISISLASKAYLGNPGLGERGVGVTVICSNANGIRCVYREDLLPMTLHGFGKFFSLDMELLRFAAEARS